MQCMTKAFRSGGESKQESRVMECILHSQEQAVIGRVSLRGVEKQLGRSPTRMWRGRGREDERCGWLVVYCGDLVGKDTCESNNMRKGVLGVLFVQFGIQY
jgi:hypothetical protein